MSKRQYHSKEFKQEAVRLLKTGQKPAAQLADELGIKRNQLYQWQDEVDLKGNDAFPGVGRRPKQSTQELASLQREIVRLKEENEILKKAAAFFAKEMK